MPFSLRPDTQWVFLGRASRPVYEHLLVMVDFFSLDTKKHLADCKAIYLGDYSARN